VQSNCIDWIKFALKCYWAKYRFPGIPVAYYLLNIWKYSLENTEGAIKLEAQWAKPVSLTLHTVLRKLYTVLSISASYQISVHLATRPIRNKNFLWRPCLLSDWDKMSIRYREPSIDASNQNSVHLPKGFQRRRYFRNLSIRNKDCLWRTCLLTDLHKMCNRYRKLYINASYQVSVHLNKWFQKKIFLEIGQSERRMDCGGHVY
jgi:hypothetical protein